MAAATGAAALTVGFAVGLAGVVGCFVPDTVGAVVLDTAGAAGRVGEAAGLVAAGFEGAAVAGDDAWSWGGAAD